MKVLGFGFIFLLISTWQFLFAQTGRPIYQSETLQIEQISAHTFVHISYLKTQDFGKVACNGMIVLNGNEALVFDTPTDDEVSQELIAWLETERKATVKGVIATHFHNDCLGGLSQFHSKGVPSYSSNQTQILAKGAEEPIPQNGFEDLLTLKAGELEVIIRFLGEGHTRDNVVAFVPAEQVLFGGCLIKEVGASKGFLGDANLQDWSETVTRVKANFPDLQIVIPGHGKVGNGELLDYTIRLFSND